MLIERLVKKDETTVIVYLDNGNKLYLSYEVVLKNGLRKGTEISEDRFDFLIRHNKKYHIRQKTLLYLARRIHSKRELENKLRQKKYEIDLINEVLNNLVEKRIINDESFALHFADEKINRKKWGFMKVKSELIKKGISSELIDKALKSYSTPESQNETAAVLAKKKLNIILKRESDPQKIKQKILSYLVSRGFSYDTSVEVIQSLLKESDDQD
jgi:regulatory protein